MRQPSSPAVLALALLFTADPRTAGAALLDPTRPLAGGASTELPSPKPKEASAVLLAAPSEAASAPSFPPALQSLQIPTQGEATALVDGHLLRVGGKVGSYEVTHIDAHGLMVRGPSGRERWTLAGVEILDSRLPASAVKAGSLGDAPKPSRRMSSEAQGPKPAPLMREPGVAAPSPLVFPLQAPQGQPLPMPRPASPPESLPPTPPGPASPTRPSLKQAEAVAPNGGAAAPLTASTQRGPGIGLTPASLVHARLQRAAKPQAGWIASAPSKALRMDLDDMRRVVQMRPPGDTFMGVGAKPQGWRRPVGPNSLGVWVASWGQAPGPARRPAFAAAETGLLLTSWRPSPASRQPQVTRATPARYTPVQGPRPMPASVVWRSPAAKSWQPQGANELPGTHPSQWASQRTPLLRIAALEPQPSSPRLFATAMATAKASSRAAASGRWAQAPAAQPVQSVAAVTHAYPMALPQWRHMPYPEADNTSSTQVAYALETP